MPHVVGGTPKWVRDLGYERFCLHGDTEEVLQLLCRHSCQIISRDKAGTLYDRCHRHRAIRTMAQRGRPSPPCASCSHVFGSRKRQKSRVFRHEARFANVAVDHQTRCVGSQGIQLAQRTRMTPCERIRGQKLPLGKQVLARQRGANVNQLLQPWVTGFWSGRHMSRSHEKSCSPSSPRTSSMGARSSAVHALHTLCATSDSSG